MDLLDKIDLYIGDDGVNEENEWQSHIKSQLEKAGKSLGSMSDEETKKFFAAAKASYKGGTNEGELPPALQKAIAAKKKKDGDKDEKKDDK